MRAFALAALMLSACARPHITIGSKKFTESVLLAEVATQLLRSTGVLAEHARELGGTSTLWGALRSGEIDAYPEYTGTIRKDLFPEHPERELSNLLAEHGIVMSPSLGFSNTYAIGMRAQDADALGIRTLSDLAAHHELVIGLSPEFLDREDGWKGLRDTYGLRHSTLRLEHDVGYRALDRGAVSAIDLYSTDAEILHRKLRVLVDDRRHFPAYDAVFLLRRDASVSVRQALSHLASAITEQRMIAMNARVLVDHRPEREVAAGYLSERFGIDPGAREGALWSRVSRRTGEHLALMLVALVAATAVALPLGLLAARRRRAGRALLGAAALVETATGLTLLALALALFGAARGAALGVLVAYALVPILRHATTALAPSAPLADAPDALRSLVAGLKTAAVHSVGTVTLLALVGEGGYGQPILAGLRLGDRALLLEGAVPAVLLALLVHALLGLVEAAVSRRRPRSAER